MEPLRTTEDVPVQFRRPFSFPSLNRPRWRAGDSLAVHAAVFTLLLSATACGGPFFLIPGGELSGEVVEAPVRDWSFVEDRFVDLETRPGDP
jgi:hypothetical protein